MADMFDYLKWRGDILFSQVPMNPVDALVFSSLSYIWYDGIVPEVANDRITLQEAAEKFFTISGYKSKVRVKKDVELLRAAAETIRFGKVELTFYRSVLVTEEETQFAALTCFLDDGTAVIVFRGTDRNLAGWKEDFNIPFYESIPAQREALRYVSEMADSTKAPFYITGHSKGGNLAVYAAAKCTEHVKERVIQIYNQDGPGFTEYLMGDSGYLSVVPKIRTYIPQSSVVGLLFEHEEPYTVVKSRQVGLLQHDPYSWEISGADFIQMEELSPDAKKIDKALKNWFAGMSIEERSIFVDTVYEILTSGGASQITELIQPQNVRTYVKALSKDEKKRQIIAGELAALIQSMREVQRNRGKEMDSE